MNTAQHCEGTMILWNIRNCLSDDIASHEHCPTLWRQHDPLKHKELLVWWHSVTWTLPNTVKATWSLEISGSACLMTWHHIPGDWHVPALLPQIFHCFIHPFVRCPQNLLPFALHWYSSLRIWLSGIFLRLSTYFLQFVNYYVDRCYSRFIISLWFTQQYWWRFISSGMWYCVEC